MIKNDHCRVAIIEEGGHVCGNPGLAVIMYLIYPAFFKNNKN
jgi:hypothetical protein